MSYKTKCNGVVPAPADKVFEMFSSFYEYEAWGGGLLEKIEILTKDKSGKEIGAYRLFNGVVKEELVALDVIDRIMKYRIHEAPGCHLANTKSFLGTVKVTPIDDNSSFLEWTADFEIVEAEAKAAEDHCVFVYSTFIKAVIAKFSS